MKEETLFELHVSVLRPTDCSVINGVLVVLVLCAQWRNEDTLVNDLHIYIYKTSFS